MNSMEYESNARFVRWSDGSLQLLIGNEVLDISTQDAQHDQAHLFLRHEKGILQSQGRILKKMRFMPSSLTSNSHRLLTALVDSRHKKVFRFKKTVTDIDPEREKEEKERAESQTIRANELLSKKKEKVSRKYTQTVRRERQLSPGFLEEALEEVKITKAERDVYATIINDKVAMKIGPGHYEPESGSQKWSLALQGNDYKAVAHIYLKLNQTSKAHEALKKVVRINPRDPESFLDLGELLFSTDSGAALEAFKTAHNLLKKSNEEVSVELLNNIGILHFEKGEFELAQQTFKEALQSDSIGASDDPIQKALNQPMEASLAARMF